MRNRAEGLPERMVVIGVPGTRRVLAFTEAARQWGFAGVEVVSYLDLIAGRCEAPAGQCLVRIESPSESSATTKAILKTGMEPLEVSGGTPLSAQEIDGLACDRGEMLDPRQWYFGYREILTRLKTAWVNCEIEWMSPPEAIATTFDKLACLENWSRAGLPVPQRFGPISTYAQLRQEIPDRHARLFVKLRYGYSAMGAVALEWRGSLVRAITTMEVVWSEGRHRLFVSKRPRVLTKEIEIAWLIDRLAKEEILVEKWLSKARWKGLPYDLRVVMIGGQTRHVVGRANASPFTNLNLDAKRIPRETIEDQLGDSWGRLESLCDRAVSAMAKSGVVALDVLVLPGQRKFVLLEANAFGDYLPGLLWRGWSTYEAELRAFRRTRPGAAA